MGKNISSKRNVTRLTVLVTAVIYLLANPTYALGDPISGSLLTTFLISAAVSAAATGAQLLVAHLMAPTQKPQEKNKLQGDIKLTGIGEDIPIPEVYGGRFADNLGGVEIGGVIVWASPIRKVVVTVPGGGGGGKGGPKAPPTQEYHYYQDLAIEVGRGPLNVLEIKANTDVLYYNNLGLIPDGDVLEAEAGTYTGSLQTLAGFSNGQGVRLTTSGQYIEFLPFTSIDWGGGYNITYDIAIAYRASANRHISLTVNGVLRNPSLPCPATAGLEIGVVQQTLSLAPSTTNVIRIDSADGQIDIDRVVVVETIVIIGGGDGCDNNPQTDVMCTNIVTNAGNLGTDVMANTTTMPAHWMLVSNILDPSYTNPVPTYDNVALVDPLEVDSRPLTEWNFQPKPDADGVMEVTTPSVSMRIYPGSATQLPDPILQAYFNSKYSGIRGSNDATPAYRHRCYVVLENFETTKYGGVPPNFVFKVEHQSIRTLGAMFKERAKHVGLTEADLDFTELEGVYLRGVPITEKQAPMKDMQLLCRVYDADIYETVDGILKGVLPDESIAATIPIEELEVQEDYDPKQASKSLPMPVQTVVRDEWQLPKIFSASFFDVENNMEVALVNSQREYTVSERHDVFDTGIALSKVEGQRFVDRELQKLYAEKDALTVKTFPKYAEIVPTNLIKVQEADGSYSTMRVKGIDGWIPGALEISGVSRNIVEVAPRVDSELLALDVVRKPRAPNVPGNVIGTLIDVAIMRNTEYQPGVYVAACLTNQSYIWRGCSVMVNKVTGYEKLTDIVKQAVIGVTVTSVGASHEVYGPVTLSPSVTVTIDLFCGELESLTSGDLDDKANAAILGEEIIQFTTATKIGGYPNRWELEVYSRGNRGTAQADHSAGTRFVLLTNAVKWLPLDYSEIGVPRDYKFVGGGQVLDNVWSTNFTYKGKAIQTSTRSIEVTADYQMDLSDGVVIADSAGGAITVHLPPVYMCETHEAFTIKKRTGTNDVVIQPFVDDGGIFIDGVSEYRLTGAWESVDIVARNGNWYIK